MGSERRAPEFPSDIEWLGARGRALRFGGELSGRVVLLCFWTASSVHSRPALATLAWLQLRFADRAFVALGVHAPRTAGERGADAVAAAMNRARVRHPVLVDDERRVFSAWNAAAWPTLALVDGTGLVRYQGAGEPDRERLAEAIEVLCDDCVAPPLPVVDAAWPPAPPAGRGALRAPAGLAIDDHRGVLWIADSGRHRIVGADLETGAIRQEIGCGLPGFANGDADLAAFADPSGLAFSANGLLIADPGNHALRRFDLDAGSVTTLCGDGAPQAEGGLGAPTAVATSGTRAIVSSAALHQLRAVPLAGGRAESVAGHGEPGLLDGAAVGAALAEPRAIAVRGEELAFVDSFADALRVFDAGSGRVETILREGLSAPCGVAWDGDDLIVCDTFADRVIRVSRAGDVAVLLDRDVRRPEAVAIHERRLFVADTGGHRVVTVDLDRGDVTEFTLHDPHGEVHDALAAPAEIRAGGLVSLSVHLPRPDGARIDAVARPLGLAGSIDGDVVALTARRVDLEGEWGVLRKVATGPPGTGKLRCVVRYATRASGTRAHHVLERDAVRSVHLTSDGVDAIEL